MNIPEAPGVALSPIKDFGCLALPGQLAAEIPGFGPVLSVADVAPSAGRFFVATSRAVVGFPLVAAVAAQVTADAAVGKSRGKHAGLDCPGGGGAHDIGAASFATWGGWGPVGAEVEVPLLGRALRLRCGFLGSRPVVATADNAGHVTVFLADVQSGTAAQELHLAFEGAADLDAEPPPPGKAAGGLAILADRPGGSDSGTVLVGNDSGQLCRWRVEVLPGGALSAEVLPVLGEPRGSAGETGILDVDVARGVTNVGAEASLSAALDGMLEFWPCSCGYHDVPAVSDDGGSSVSSQSRHDEEIDAIGPDAAASNGQQHTVSPSSARADGAEAPSLWGVRWVPLRTLLSSPIPEGSAGSSVTGPEPPGGQAALDWRGLPGEIIRKSVLPQLSFGDLASHLAPACRACRWAVERELTGEHRTDSLSFCFSDGTAWLMNGRLGMLARLDFPFCAAHSSAVLVPGLAVMLVAPKTDLVVVEGPGIAVMPHVWAVSCWRRHGCWRPRLHARRLDLRHPHRAVAAAADMSAAAAVAGGNAAVTDRAPQESQAGSPQPSPRESSHVLGLAATGGDDFGGGAQVWALLASGELLVQEVRVASGPFRASSGSEGAAGS